MRHRAIVLVATATAALGAACAPAHADRAPPPVSPVIPERAPAVVAAVRMAQDLMRAKLLEQTPKAEIVVREEAGPFGTVIAVAADPKAYPGTGVMRTVIDGGTGVTYGARGARTFADFVREHGWLTTAPKADVLVRFMNTALFDGIAILDLTGDTPPSVTTDATGLHIEVVRRSMPSNAGERLVVTVPAAGPETIAKKPLTPAQGPAEK